MTTQTSERLVVSLKEITGDAYIDFWDDEHEFRALKGSRGSGKSKIIALNLIYRMSFEYPLSNCLVVRRFYNSLRNSCLADLMWAVNKLYLSDVWAVNTSQLRMTHKKTGQVILFGGMDNPDSITSISVTHGFLNFCWVEEAFQITSEDAFDKLHFSIRGELPEGYFKQITLSFNPWSEHTWLKPRFFDEYIVDSVTGEKRPNDLHNVFSKTTTYRDNKFLSDVDRADYERISLTNPRAARVICNGEWGAPEGQIYTNWEIADFELFDVLNIHGTRMTYGLDFGFATSYNAFIAAAVNIEKRTIWIWDEMYERGLSNLDIAKKITDKGYAKEEIWADAASPKDIFTLQSGSGLIEPTLDKDDQMVLDENGNPILTKYRLPSIKPALKGNDSVEMGIRWLQSFRIIVHPRCRNVEMELNNYSWAMDKDGVYSDKPIKDFDHLMDALRYSMAKFFLGSRAKMVEASGRDKFLPASSKTNISTGYKSRRVIATRTK